MINVDNKSVIIGLGVFALLSLGLNTYFAEPRPFLEIIIDLLIPILVLLTVIFLLHFYSKEVFIAGGSLFFFLVILTYFSDLIAKPYGTFLFLFSAWMFMSAYNLSSIKTCILKEVCEGNRRLLLGVVMATFIFGFVTEVVNLPFLIWKYNIPLPSYDLYGVPALMAAFGWTPWILAILEIFYHYNAHKN